MAASEDCYLTPTGVECRAGGTTTSVASGWNPVPVDPIRYLAVRQGSCWYWSRHPPGIDSWDLGNDTRIIRTITRLPECRWEEPASTTTTPTSQITARAWEIFRSFPLGAPAVRLEPAGGGITGLPSFASAIMPPPLQHSEGLPDGTMLEVAAEIAEVRVDWGDGSPPQTHAASSFLPRPQGSAWHVYARKTCPPRYRREHPSGPNCHPDLAAYPVRVDFVWRARYRRDGGWIELGELRRERVVWYDVDEVVGVLG